MFSNSLEMKTHTLLILKKSGICIYSRNFTKKFKNLNVNLVSSFISAISTFSEEVTQRKLEILEMMDIRFVFKIQDDFIYVLLADLNISPQFLVYSLNRISKAFLRFYKKYNNSIDYRAIKNKRLDIGFDLLIRGLIDYRHNFYIKTTSLMKKLVNENEILGAAVISIKGNVIYSSLPGKILVNILNEIEIRSKGKELDISGIIYTLKSGQKILSREVSHKSILRKSYIIILLYESSTSLGIAEISSNKIVESIKSFL